MAQSLATPAFAGTAEKKWVVVDYYLTTIAEKINMCPWRSWIARVTPTHKVAGSNPVGHTIKSYRYRCVWRKARRINRFRAFLSPDFFF